jgi:hypothetical protein
MIQKVFVYNSVVATNVCSLGWGYIPLPIPGSLLLASNLVARRGGSRNWGKRGRRVLHIDIHGHFQRFFQLIKLRSILIFLQMNKRMELRMVYYAPTTDCSRLNILQNINKWSAKWSAVPNCCKKFYLRGRQHFFHFLRCFLPFFDLFVRRLLCQHFSLLDTSPRLQRLRHLNR